MTKKFLREQIAGAVDLGSDHYLRYYGWAPDRRLNPQYDGLADVEKLGATIIHRQGPNEPHAGYGGLWGVPGWCAGSVMFKAPETDSWACRPRWPRRSRQRLRPAVPAVAHPAHADTQTPPRRRVLALRGARRRPVAHDRGRRRGRLRRLPARIAELRGHDLACWCPLDVACHADVLLELANA